MKLATVSGASALKRRQTMMPSEVLKVAVDIGVDLLAVVAAGAAVERRRTPGAKARMFARPVRPKAEALGYLEAKTWCFKILGLPRSKNLVLQNSGGYLEAKTWCFKILGLPECKNLVLQKFWVIGKQN